MRIPNEIFGVGWLNAPNHHQAGICLTQHSNATPWAAGAALSSIVYSMHDVSGGHVNPAVTVAAVLNGKCPVERGGSHLPCLLVVSFLSQNPKIPKGCL
jgi:glycerol uptake facilitator-like aquaporin